MSTSTTSAATSTPEAQGQALAAPLRPQGQHHLVRHRRRPCRPSHQRRRRLQPFWRVLPCQSCRWVPPHLHTSTVRSIRCSRFGALHDIMRRAMQSGSMQVQNTRSHGYSRCFAFCQVSTLRAADL